MRIIQTIILTATITSEVFCSYKSPRICPITLFYLICQRGEFGLRKVWVVP